MRVFRSRLAAWLLALISIAFVTEIGRLAGLNPSTVGFAYLIVVLLISLWGGLLVGTVSSVVAARIQAEAAEQRRKELEMVIAENAHLQAVRESEAMKTSLLRAISHDLTTPITAITLRTESLRRHAADDADLLEDLSAIAEETSRLRRRIDNLLSMARLEAGKAMPHREPTPPADIFRAARENLPLVFAARTIAMNVAADCPDANVDPSLALEILVNLLENAHRVSPPAETIEL